jgi:hypothetical protein
MMAPGTWHMSQLLPTAVNDCTSVSTCHCQLRLDQQQLAAVLPLQHHAAALPLSESKAPCEKCA